ncbi:hypothetical protein BJ138DRAFT_1144558 [Hygrophoropsis aurantiaca]|uniref:Uncharacterized protein n=1 Tax=Hygrophoropsis aurantiaca TaxID=72124 RepID=A0ACB8AM36_9AGAM|nr:hypothetical protein BJ138DRAFT_1144558 [Hygrophoropsis aurantiaca]
MVGRKRTAEETAEKRETRSGKVAKTEHTKSPRNAGKGGKGGARLKTSLSTTAFKTRALPLHVNITHTPPSVPDEESESVAQADPGFLGTTALVPSSFSTGSFGWKGNKRMTIEIPAKEEGGENETVHVMLTINATVIGSKDTKGGDEDEPEKAEDGAKGENGENGHDEAVTEGSVKDQEEPAETEEKGEEASTEAAS